ncbi:MAG: DarT ssDNA thymidine ADP-ribosyltransferase family protein [bacterium]
MENVPSIMEHGILSHNKSKKLQFRDISKEGVQARRAVKKIPGTNKNLHDYANLYFDSHNPMLSARRSVNDEICVLRIKNDILELNGVIITDMNAARDCWFKTVKEGLPLLDRDEIYTINWKNTDPIKDYRYAGIKCAEVLVPNYVPSGYIFGAYVANDIASKKFCKISDIKCIIRNDLFF